MSSSHDSVESTIKRAKVSTTYRSLNLQRPEKPGYIRNMVFHRGAPLRKKAYPGLHCRDIFWPRMKIER
jgi:hypothetical protein